MWIDLTLQQHNLQALFLVSEIAAITADDQRGSRVYIKGNQNPFDVLETVDKIKARMSRKTAKGE